MPGLSRDSGDWTRRSFLAAAVGGTLATAVGISRAGKDPKKAQIGITLDLEMSRHYPKRGMLEWDYQKGNLDEATKQYSLRAARVAKERGGKIHFFCVGRVLEQPDIGWLQEIIKEGHPVGNHTYDHVNVWTKDPKQTQFRFQRSPWLIRGKEAADIVRENVRVTTLAMKERLGIVPDGFRTPGGSNNALNGREDIQKLLLDEGFRWVSSKYPAHKSGEIMKPPTLDVYASIVRAQAEAQPYVYPTGLIEIPMSPISDVTAFRSKYWKLEYFLKAVRLATEWAIENRAVFDFLAHPSCLGVEDPGFETIKLICDIVKDAGDKAQIVGLSTIADGVRG